MRECACQSQEEHDRRNAGWQRKLRQDPRAVVWDLNAHRLLDQDGQDVPENEERAIPDPSVKSNRELLLEAARWEEERRDDRE
ncbi:MAG: hypothetical protein AABM42_02110 [Actinomycetota bacterium]